MEVVREKIEEAFRDAAPGEFKSIEEALAVVGSALRYLTDQCDDIDTEVPDGSETSNID